MGIYVARHGLSAANDKGNPAFGSSKAQLLDLGIKQAEELGCKLISEYSIDPAIETVAVSTLIRTAETAKYAGFVTINSYAQLDEVNHGLDLEGFERMKETRVLPLHAMREAEKTLDNPPEEKIWITHELKIAAMCQILAIYQEDRLFQKFCEVRYLPIGD